MKIRVVSDLHWEFAPDGGVESIHTITAEPFDVLVIAGDLTNAAGLPAALRLVADTVKQPVIYVHGNHEFYGSNRAKVCATTIAATRGTSIMWLDCGEATIDGHRFVGTPLWFRKSSAPTWAMTDFSVIEGYRDWVYDQNGRARAHLEREVKPGDIVVTHHLPAEQCVAPQYKGNALNPFFLCDMSHVINRQKPGLWCFGHTHSSVNTGIGETELLCNPYGYFGHEVNQQFDRSLTVEVGT